MLDRHASAERFNQLEQGALLRGAGEDPLAVHERRQLAAEDGDAARATHWFGRDM